MLFIRRNLRLKTLQMLQNGLIILTFIWSLMRIVNFSHDSVTSVMTLISVQSKFHIYVVLLQNPLHMVFLFHSWYIMLGFIRNMIFCSEDLFWFQSYWSRAILHENFRLLFGNYMVVIHTLFTNLTPLCHICQMVCSLTVTCDWFPVMWNKSCRVPHVGLETPTLSGTPHFTHSLYIHFILLNLSVLGLCLHIKKNSGWFAWIRLPALSD